jgi:hypothetical protein
MREPMNSEYRTPSSEYRIARARATGVALVKDTRLKAITPHDPRRRALDRQLHGAVIEATKEGVAGGPFADWWYDLRRQQLRIYGGLLRFIDLSILRRVPKWVLLMIPDALRAYIEDQHPDGGTAR